MPGLTLIQELPDVHGLKGHHKVLLQAERTTLAKRRWRGTARDGREFGFDLDATLSDGTPFHVDGNTFYVIEQLPEELLEIPVTSIKQAARIAWNLGNLHFGVEVSTHFLRVPPDPAVHQFLEREQIGFRKIQAVFLPLSGAAHHHHHA